MPVKFEDMMRELFAPAERAAIRRTAAGIAKRHIRREIERNRGHRKLFQM